jgi:chromosome transmission fidelity protein 4
MDKEFVQLIQGACKASNIPRAIELVKLLQNLASYDMAIKIAEFYHLVGLQEKIEILKSVREAEEDRLVIARDKRKQWLRPDPLPHRLPSVNGGVSAKPNLLQDFGPPPVIHRPGLTRATPVVEMSRFSSNDHLNELPDSESKSIYLPDSPPDSKRKRNDSGDLFTGTDDSCKRRAVEGNSMRPPPKPSTCPKFIYEC